MFESKTSVKMYDTDAAGILYFASQFRFAHEAFEELLLKEGYTFADLLEREPFIFVIVHAESDYVAALKVGDKIDVKAWVSKIGNSSFEFSYHFFRDDELVGKAKTNHVTLSRVERQKIEIPNKVKSILNKYSNFNIKY
ncbi:acyl-CoA thioesterase [bacterium]|jgi:1,4-dihydroxy-2-naphthoyl-CoA hydrolase|nr:acyl-CoA thioesterase [bacterium]